MSIEDEQATSARPALRTFEHPQAPGDEELANRHTFHERPNALQLAHYDAIRGHVLDLAKFIRSHTPSCREQSIALTRLEEAQFFAISSISRNPLHFEESRPKGTVENNLHEGCSGAEARMAQSLEDKMVGARKIGREDVKREPMESARAIEMRCILGTFGRCGWNNVALRHGTLLIRCDRPLKDTGSYIVEIPGPFGTDPYKTASVIAEEIRRSGLLDVSAADIAEVFKGEGYERGWPENAAGLCHVKAPDKTDPAWKLFEAERQVVLAGMVQSSALRAYHDIRRDAQ